MADLIQDPIDLYVGARIRLSRSQAHVSQRELAEATGITFQQMQKYEKGVDRISASKLHAVARALNTPVRWFFEGADLLSVGDEANRLAKARRINAFLAKPEAFDLAATFGALSPAKRKMVLDLVRGFADSEAVQAPE